MKRRYLPTIGVSAVAAIALLGIFWKGCPESQVRSGLICVSQSGQAGSADSGGNTEGSTNQGELEERFSKGERLLFSDKRNVDSIAGTEAIIQQDYRGAIASFSRAVASSRSEPEPQIYLNNAIANEKGNPYTLAVVVPIEGRIGPSKEILRGVADAQSRFNKSGGVGDRLLEILIADDGNDKDMAAAVAAGISERSDVLGVVGHNSSSASLAALPAYESAGIAMVSPTSSSTELSGKESFFRTIPSDAETGKQLASYAEDAIEAEQVAIFFDSSSTYSTSLLEAFKSEFDGGVTSEIKLDDDSIEFENEVTQLPSEVSAILLFPSTNTVTRAIGIARANFDLSASDRLPMIGGDSLYDGSTLTEGGPAVEGMVLAVPWFANTTYAEEAQSQWGGQVSWRTASSYDATQALINTLSDGASRSTVLSDVEAVRLDPEETSGNSLAFEGTGDRAEEPLLVQAVRGGNKPEGSEFGFELLK